MQHTATIPDPASNCGADDAHRASAYASAHVAVELAMPEFMPAGMTPALGRCFDVAEKLLENAREAASSMDWDGARSSLRMLATLLEERVKRLGDGDARSTAIRRAAMHTVELAVCAMSHRPTTTAMLARFADEAVRSCDSVTRFSSMPPSAFYATAEA